MKKLKVKVQVHMLPTTHKDHQLELWGKWLFSTIDGNYSDREPKPIPQHLYFTSDEKIEYYDWVYNPIHKTIYQWLKNANIKFDKINAKKIVATDDPELWHMVNTSYTTVEPHFAPAKIPTSFIETYVKSYAKNDVIKEVFLEAKILQEESTWDVSRTIVLKHGKLSAKLKLCNDGSVIVHPIKERMYTREEFIEAVTKALFEKGSWYQNEVDEYINNNYPE